MDRGFGLFPEQASKLAPEVDALYLYLWGITIFFTVLIFALILYFAIKYRRRREDEVPHPVVESVKLELFYTIVPFLIAMTIFAWGTKVAFDIYKEPVDPLDIHVVGKQWMWKVQHPEGAREINALHVPVGRTIQLTLSSQDVIHSFYLPSMRVKMDAVPGRYTRISFEPVKVGSYHIFCAEYCGTQHSGMIGTITVMEPADYDAWLAGVGHEEAPAVSGEKLFLAKGCATCHGQQAPSLKGIFGTDVRYAEVPGGPIKTTKVTDDYLRESILYSTSKIVEGYQPIMPSFRGQISEEELSHLIAYIKGLKSADVAPPRVTPIGGAGGQRR